MQIIEYGLYLISVNCIEEKPHHEQRTERSSKAMNIQKARNATSKTRNLVHPTKKPMPKAECVNPYAPFEGVDGKTYEISYPTNLNEVTNCYAFALGIRAKGDPRRDYFPGFLAGYPFCMEICENLDERVRADLEALGRTVHEFYAGEDIPKCLPRAKPGTVWIKALKTPKADEGMHFMVKHEASGRWIHKMGWFSPPKVVVRNLKVRSDLDMVLEENPVYRERFLELDPEDREMFRAALGNMKSLASSVLEYEDNASYWALPEDAEEFDEYKPLWVMRISE